MKTTSICILTARCQTGARRFFVKHDVVPNFGVVPAKAGIQYAAAFRSYRERLRLLGPRLRGDDE